MTDLDDLEALARDLRLGATLYREGGRPESARANERIAEHLLELSRARVQLRAARLIEGAVAKDTCSRGYCAIRGGLVQHACRRAARVRKRQQLEVAT